MPLILSPFAEETVALEQNAELKIEMSLLSKPMIARYKASVIASRSVREVRMCGCDMLRS